MRRDYAGKRVLVLGGHGFIGVHVAPALSVLGADGAGTLSWTPQDGSAQRRIDGSQLVDPVNWNEEAGALKRVTVMRPNNKPDPETSGRRPVCETALTSVAAGGAGWVHAAFATASMFSPSWSTNSRTGRP